MKTRSCLSFTPLGAVLALACMILAGGAAAKASNYNFELTQVSLATCTGPGLYKVRMSFKPAPNAKDYIVNSNNACQLGGVPCSGRGTACKVPCAGPGPCTFDLDKCQQGRGSQSVEVVVPYVYNPNTKPIQAPTKPCP